MFLSHKNILIGVSGSISTYKIGEVISFLKKQNCDVKVIATESALQFVGKATFEGLTGHAVLTNDFTNGSMMSHIQLAKWADLFIIAPATAQTINSLAQGAGGGILVSTYLAYDLNKPLLLAPAMNTRMLEHPTTQLSMKKLSEMGLRVLATGSGDLACGDVGLGRLLDPQDIISEINAALTPTKSFSILITAGGTKIPIDSVRSITNTSSGKTGAQLADYLTNQNYKVDLLLSKDGFKASCTKNISYFETYDDLALLMEEKLKTNKYDLVIHAAAVSDFKLAKGTSGKIPSASTYSLQLKPTEKLIAKIKGWNKNCKLIGFKLTDTKSLSLRSQAIEKIFAHGADWVVHNDLAEIKKGAHPFSIYSRNKKMRIVDGQLALAKAFKDDIISPLETKNKKISSKKRIPLTTETLQ
jgi:phosphopantothenoylcysteine decarboxylase / phosphopantothenate---cysteine ligase